MPVNWEKLASHELRSLMDRLPYEPTIGHSDLYRRIGDTLGAALLTDEIANLFRTEHDRCLETTDQTHLRLCLDIDEQLPEIAALPWEFLRYNDLPLAVSPPILLTRSFPHADYGLIPPLAADGEPHVLLVIPEGSGLDTSAERDSICSVLAEAGIPHDVLEGPVTVEAVGRALVQHTSRILHFIGHGGATKSPEGRLVGVLRFNTTEDGASEHWLAHEQVQALLAPHQRYLRLVVLNVCLGGIVGGRLAGESGKGFVGLAPSILRAHVPAVVAMQYAIRDQVAIRFAKTFYRALVTGDRPGYVDVAVTEARRACFLDFPEEPGFATPVLFLRAQDGCLFQRQTRAEMAQPTAPVPPARRVPLPPRLPNTPAFVGRAAELAHLGRLLTTQHCIALTGIAGAGKTALAARLARETGADDRTFWHRCRENDGLSSLIRALAGFLWHQRQPALWEAFANTGTDEAARLREPPADLVLDLVRGQDLLLCLDDFQHVDSDPRSLELIEGLFRTGAPGRALAHAHLAPCARSALSASLGVARGHRPRPRSRHRAVGIGRNRTAAGAVSRPARPRGRQRPAPLAGGPGALPLAGSKPGDLRSVGYPGHPRLPGR